MKKIFAIAASVFMIAIIITLIAMPSRAFNSPGKSNPSITSSIPDSVSKILEKSCFPCHSDPGKSMAMSKLNFDKWETYKPEKQASKAKAICKEVTKQGMPPKSFRENNPDKVPTQAEVKIICNWAASFPSKESFSSNLKNNMRTCR
jgi:hypothetical protein